ncbi:MAG: GHKL domain-containing protein [Lachnospiraceae bacterium]|nr:GHKL domain-containing protein [Lachnospiraceae bacterium]
MEILLYLPYTIGNVWAIDVFCKKFLEVSKEKEKLFLLFLFSGKMLLFVLSVFCGLPFIIHALFRHALVIGLVMLSFQTDWEKKLLAASISITVITLVVDFCDSFLSVLVLFILHNIKGIPVPIIEVREAYLTAYIASAIAVFMLIWLSKRLKYVFFPKIKKWYITISVPLLAVTTMIDIEGWGAEQGILVRSGGNLSLYYDQLFSYIGIFTFTALSMFATGFYVFGMNRIYLEHEKSSQYHSQIAAYKMLDEQYSQSERLRHDMKNHIIALSGLLNNRELEKMEDYLQNMKDSGNLGNCEEVTGSRVVDALLYQKRKLAEQSNIAWECDVQIPEICRINEFDLCVLFGNLLDNALQACERLQCSNLGNDSDCFIDIQAKAVKKYFLLEVKNSTNVTVTPENRFTSKNNVAWHRTRFTSKNNIAKHEVESTVKNNVSGHGIGLLNVKDVVSKYNGAMNMNVENSIFVISILLPLNNAAHDINKAI